MALYDALRVSPTVDFAAELLHDRGSDEIATLLEECGIGSGPELLARLRGPPPGDDDVNARVATLKETSGRVRDEIVVLERVKDKIHPGHDEAEQALEGLDSQIRALKATTTRLEGYETALIPPPEGVSGGGANAAKTLRSTLNQGPLHDPTPWYVDTGPRRDPDKPVDLRAVFDAFCALYRQTHMSNMTFWKFSNDSSLIDENYVKADVDIFWTKIAKSRQHIPFEDFLQLVDLIAERKGVDRAELDFYIVENAKPKMTGTRGAEAFSFCKWDEQKAAEKLIDTVCDALELRLVARPCLGKVDGEALPLLIELLLVWWEGELRVKGLGDALGDEVEKHAATRMSLKGRCAVGRSAEWGSGDLGDQGRRKGHG